MRYEDQYRQALLAQPAVSTITLADGQPVAVEEVYVPRTLLHEVKQKQTDRQLGDGTRAGTKAAAPEREITVKLPVELWPKLRDERVVLVEGPAGMGKSTLTKQLVRESGAHHLIPIWIPFRAFVASRLSLRDYLEQHYVPWLGLAGLRVPYRADGTGPDRSLGQWCYEQWQSGLGLLIVDGLDEVFRHDERVTVLRGLPITGTGVTRPATILTSRPLSQSLPLPMAKVEVQGLTPPEQRRFMEKYHASLRLTKEQMDHFTSITTKQEQGRLRELLTRPGHLIQILTTYATTNTLVDTETAVLDELLKNRLTITGRSEPSVEGDDAEKKRLVLASLALHLLACRQGQRHTRAQLFALIQQVLTEHATHGTPLFPLAQATALLNDLTRNSALLTEVEPEVYEFETVIWLQHLTGTVLANPQIVGALKLTDAHILDFLDKKAWDPEWEPVLKSWVGTAHDPLPLFTHLTDKQQDDLARYRLGTAGRCLNEVSAGVGQQPGVQQLRDRVSIEAFEQWKAESERGTEKLVETSLRGVWAEMQYGQSQLIALLAYKNSYVGRSVSAALRLLRPVMPRFLQWAFVFRLAEKNRVREAAVSTLAGMGATMPEVVQLALVAQMADQRRPVRVAAEKALAGVGAAMPETVQRALVSQMRDQNWQIKWASATALARMGAAMPETVQQELVAHLVDVDKKEWAWRSAAAGALAGMGAAMPEAVQQVLVARLPNQNWYVREAFEDALIGIGVAMPQVAQQALVARLTHKRSFRRLFAAAKVEAMRMGGAMPVAVQQALVARLADRSWFVRLAVASALAGMGGAMPEAVQQALVAQLAHEQVSQKVPVAIALAGMGAAMPEEIRRALATIADKNDLLKAAHADALAGMGGAMPEAVQQKLVAQLTHKNSLERWLAASALAGMGAAMPEAVQQVMVARLAHRRLNAREAAANLLSSAQKQGLRLFRHGVGGHGRLVSDLSATAPILDGCYVTSMSSSCVLQSC